MFLSRVTYSTLSFIGFFALPPVTLYYQTLFGLLTPFPRIKIIDLSKVSVVLNIIFIPLISFVFHISKGLYL